MARLWRSVIVLALCFAAVLAMRIYLNKQIEIAKGTSSEGVSPGEVTAR